MSCSFHSCQLHQYINIPTVDTLQRTTWLKLRGWQKDKQNFFFFLIFLVNISISYNGIIFYNNCRNSDILYWSRAFELILYLAGLTSWCSRIKFPPSLFMNTMNLVDNLNLSLSLHNTHNHCHPFINKVKKQLFLPFKVCDIVIVIHTTNLYNLGQELITVCWNKQQHIVKLIIQKINLIQSFFYSNDNDNNNKKQHFNCSVFKKKQEVNIIIILICIGNHMRPSTIKD